MSTTPSDAQIAEGNRLKDVGNRAFAAREWTEAISAYTEGLEADATNHVLYSNRSGAYLSSGDVAAAIADAQKCVALAPTFAKGHGRLGAALVAGGRPAEAVAAYATALAHDPTNAATTAALVAAQQAAAPRRDDTAAVTSAFGDLSTGGAPGAPGAPDAGPIIGIDLGTTYSCVAVWENDQVTVIANSEGARTTPSIVSFGAHDRLIGAAAAAQAASNAANTVYDAKRLIGRSIKDPAIQDDLKRFPFGVVAGADEQPQITVEFKGETKTFAPEEISAMVLLKMKSTAEAYLGRPVSRAVVTVPAYFNDGQRQATKTAGAIAGLDVKRIINEPTAAALAYGLDKKAAEAAAGGPSLDADWDADAPTLKKAGAGGKGGKGGKGGAARELVVIFDLGGGTFDVSLLAIEDGIFEVQSTGGDTHLGGEDFDHVIQDWCFAEFRRKAKLTDERTRALLADKRAMRRLRTACERAKRILSAQVTSQVEVESFADGEDLAVTLSRAKFEELNAAHFKRCIDTVKAVLRDGGVSPSEVNDVVLVGGSTRIPKVQTMLSEFFGGKELCRSINPDEAVAYGAAVQGAILAGVRSSATQALLLVDVTPLSLGIDTEGNVMSTVIKRNSTIPCKRTKEYSTVEDYQTSIDIGVYEGERPITTANHLLGEFRLDGIERAKRGEPKVEVTFELDANGILSVTAMDVNTRARANITISNATGHRSSEEVEAMVAEAARMARDDESRLALINARNELESTLYSARQVAMASESVPLRAAVTKLESWLDEAGPATPLSAFKTQMGALQAALARA